MPASTAGADLDADLMKGEGTDDTAKLQSILDRASGGRPVQFILDGAAFVGGLDVYGNTTIEDTAGGGLFLKDARQELILRNNFR